MSVSLIDSIESSQMKDNDFESFRIGDTVKVYFRIVEGKSDRVQIMEGVVIAKKNSGLSRTFMVRKISYGVGVERIFPLHSPRVEKVEVIRRGKVRRAKLYFLRDRVGKSARIKEKIVRREDKKS